MSKTIQSSPLNLPISPPAHPLYHPPPSSALPPPTIFPQQSRFPMNSHAAAASPSLARARPSWAFPSSAETVKVPSSDLREAMQNIDHEMHPGLPPARSRSSSPGTEVGVPVNSDKAKAMIQCVRNLQHLGITDAEPDLPSICVIGDQSVGKSSLIEAISGISVPRSAGCCTRCPLEINMTNTSPSPVGAHTAEPWKCDVFLMHTFELKNLQQKPNKARPFGPWVNKGMTDAVQLGTMHNKRDLLKTIERAQIAVLNPSKHPVPFLHCPPNHPMLKTSEVKFSPNVIRLDIYDTEVPDLSLYDLPGVISVPENEDERYLVSVVEALVKVYIKNKSSINLLALPMNNDATNSKAANLIQQFGNKSRTVGVLTKPDLYQNTESFEQWRDILNGDKFACGHGYFVVRNLADASLGPATARKEEHKFFSQGVWASEQLKEKRSRFGTDRLAKALTYLLEEQIRYHLPTVREKVSNAMAGNEEALARLPPRLDVGAVVMVNKSLLKFENRLQALFGCTSVTNTTFRKEWITLAEDFHDHLESTKPSMKKRSRFETKRALKRQRSATSHSPTPASRIVEHDVVDIDSDDDTMTHTTGLRRRRDEVWAVCKGLGQSFFLEDIRRISKESYMSNIPDLMNPRAIELMNQKSIQHWNEPLNIFLQQLKAIVLNAIKEEAARAFDPYQQGTRLYHAVMKRTNEFFIRAIEEQRHRSEQMLEIEVQCPYTLDHASMNSHKRGILNMLRNARKHSRWEDFLAEEQTPRKDKKIKEELLGPDEWDKEVEMLATVRAYYAIASSRFCDNICQSIQAILFGRCSTVLYQDLEETFKINTKEGEEICEKLLADDPDVIRQRKKYEADIERLEKALAEIETVYSGDSSDTSYVGTIHGSGTTNGSTSMMELRNFNQSVDSEMYD